MKANKELNHTTSHLLAAAVLKLFPETKLGFGPATSEGFYYDFEFKEPLSDSDLLKNWKNDEKTSFKKFKNGTSFFKWLFIW